MLIAFLRRVAHLPAVVFGALFPEEEETFDPAYRPGITFGFGREGDE